MIQMRVARNDFAKIGARIVAESPVLVDETLGVLKERIEQTVPRQSGREASNVTVVPAHPEADGTRGSIELEFYWFFREFGTHREAAQPRVIPAVELLRAPFVAGVRRLVEQA